MLFMFRDHVTNLNSHVTSLDHVTNLTVCMLPAVQTVETDLTPPRPLTPRTPVRTSVRSQSPRWSRQTTSLRLLKMRLPSRWTPVSIYIPPPYLPPSFPPSLPTSLLPSLPPSLPPYLVVCGCNQYTSL